MTAQVFFVLASAKNAVQVPLTALRPISTPDQAATRARPGRAAQSADQRSQFRNGRALVSVVAQNGDITEREVQVGVMTRVAAEITSGLTPGETVVIGTKTAPKPDTATATATGGAMTAGQNQGRGR